MNSKENPEEFYERFHSQLLASQNWPGIYMFKFILKSNSSQIESIKKIFDNTIKEISLVNSSRETYKSLTIKIQMESPDEVISIYKRISKFDDVIIL